MLIKEIGRLDVKEQRRFFEYWKQAGMTDYKEKIILKNQKLLDYINTGETDDRHEEFTDGF